MLLVLTVPRIESLVATICDCSNVKEVEILDSDIPRYCDDHRTVEAPKRAQYEVWTKLRTSFRISMAIAIKCLQRSMNRILSSTIRPQTANTMYVFYDTIDDDGITQLKKLEDEDPVAVSEPSFTNSGKRPPLKTS